MWHHSQTLARCWDTVSLCSIQKQLLSRVGDLVVMLGSLFQSSVLASYQTSLNISTAAPPDRLTRYFIAVSALSAVPDTGGVALSATHPTPHLQSWIITGRPQRPGHPATWTQREQKAINTNPDKKTKPHQTRMSWKPTRPPKLSAPAATNLPGQPNSPNTPQSVCDVNRIGRVNPWRVCLVHSGDVCLLSQALVPFPRSSRPSSKQRLLPKRKEKIPNSQRLPLNHALAALFHPGSKSTE